MRLVIRRAFGVVLAVGVLSALLAASATPAGAASCQSWKVRPSPNPAGASHNNVLDHVAATSGRNAWAVGYVGYYSKGPMARTLIERWNGKAWRVQKSPNPGGTGDVNYLQDVAATSRTNAWAVGEYSAGSSGFHALLEHWNGKAWTVQKSAKPRGTDINLFGVTAISATDAWAVGHYSSDSTYLTFVEHWNGKAWKVQNSPDPGGFGNDLYGVTAISATDAWAVGDYQTATGDGTLVEHWNGRAWKVKPSPSPEGSNYELAAVAASSSSDAWAVGSYLAGTGQQTLVERWNGTAWKVEKTPTPGGNDNLLFGVATIYPSNVWVGGYSSSRTLFEHWNGTTWKILKRPNPGAKANLVFGMAATSATNVWAVGDYYTTSNARTLTMHCG
jgi:erythromycin esterase-like protein